MGYAFVTSLHGVHYKPDCALSCTKAWDVLGQAEEQIPLCCMLQGTLSFTNWAVKSLVCCAGYLLSLQLCMVNASEHKRNRHNIPVQVCCLSEFSTRWMLFFSHCGFQGLKFNN